MKSRWADYLKMARAILQGGYEAGQDGRNRVDGISTGGCIASSSTGVQKRLIK